MESIKNFNNEKIQNEELKHIVGGIATTYACPSGDGSVGDDTMYDTNGDGKIGKGDYALLDTGDIVLAQ